MVSAINETELCPLGYVIGGNGLTIPWDSAIERGEWDELKNKNIAINILTVIRNAMESYEGSNEKQPNLTERVREDMILLNEYFKDVHDATIEFYRINYDSLTVSKLPNYRLPTTDKQKFEHEIRMRVVKDINLEVRKYDNRVPAKMDYIISHILLDIASATKTTKLIETHTGSIKPYIALNSKLNLNDAEYTVIPFNLTTYYLYGDKVLLKKNTKITRPLLSRLLDARITPLSTETRFNMGVKHRDPLLYKFIKDIL